MAVRLKIPALETPLPRWLSLPGRFQRRAADVFPPTWRGFLLGLICGLALWRWGYGQLDLILFVLGIAGLVLVLISSIATAIAAYFLSKRIDTSTGAVHHLEAEHPVQTAFRVSALQRWPLVQVSWEWLAPGGVAVRTRLRETDLTEEVTAECRGLAPAIRRRITVGGAFGLSRISWERETASQLLILPDVGGLRHLPVVPSLAAAEGLPHPAGKPEGDRMEIRRYVPGDSPRHILWKTYARTGQLNVRTPERSIEHTQRTVAYLVAAPGDEPAAAAARVALERGDLGENWLFGVDGSAQTYSESQPALRAIAASVDTRLEGAGLHTFLEKIHRAGNVSCLVFAPAREGAWIDHVLSAIRGFSGAVSFVLAVDGIDRDPPAPWRRFLFTEPENPAVPADELTRVLRRLGSAGSVEVLDRVSGRAYGEAHQRALRKAS